MKKTGLEIVEMIAKGKAPKKIKLDTTIYEYKCNDEEEGYQYYREGVYGCYLKLMKVLNEEFEIIEEPKVWKPKEGEKYYSIESGKEVNGFVWGNGCWENADYNIGNCFKTEEEAQKVLEKIKIYVRLKRYAEEHNEEKIDFKNNYQVKYYLCYNHYHERIETENFRQTIIGQHYQFIGNIYFTDKEEAEQAIQEIGEDNIKKLFED